MGLQCLALGQNSIFHSIPFISVCLGRSSPSADESELLLESLGSWSGEGGSSLSGATDPRLSGDGGISSVAVASRPGA